MKLIACILLVTISYSFLPLKNGEDVVSDMHKKYAGKWYRTFTFNQTTQQYKNDSLVRTSTWYEYIKFPDQFRIDFGDKKDSNAVIYLKDSIYSFKKGKLVRKQFNDDNLTFLLGGMYSYPLDTVKGRLKKDGYDLTKLTSSRYDNEETWVIGAVDTAEKSNQLWISKEKLIVLKFIKYDGSNKEEGRFTGHKKYGGGWSESACDFYVNDKLIQKEVYHDCKADVNINPAIFDPYKFVERE